MFNKAQDLAEAALALISQADQCIEIDQYDNAGRLEFAAAALAVHVADWHFLPASANAADKEKFSKIFPDYLGLLSIMNGIKHPHNTKHNRTEMQPGWEDNDWLEKSGLPGELIANIQEEWRSVNSLVVGFCNAYLVHSKADKTERP